MTGRAGVSPSYIKRLLRNSQPSPWLAEGVLQAYIFRTSLPEPAKVQIVNSSIYCSVLENAATSNPVYGNSVYEV